jgi:transcriptional regulator with XRE-family HTH domain
MKKPTNWERYYAQQMENPNVRWLVEEELKALRVGVQIARLRQQKGLSQTQLAARVGMSSPNISRIETSPSRNLTLGTLVKLARALGHDVQITFPPKRTVTSTMRARAAKA